MICFRCKQPIDGSGISLDEGTAHPLCCTKEELAGVIEDQGSLIRHMHKTAALDLHDLRKPWDHLAPWRK